MSSGTTSLTPDQVKERCWQKLKEASAEYVKVNDQIARRLAKDGITNAEFVEYAMNREAQNITENGAVL